MSREYIIQECLSTGGVRDKRLYTNAIKML